MRSIKMRSSSGVNFKSLFADDFGAAAFTKLAALEAELFDSDFVTGAFAGDFAKLVADLTGFAADFAGVFARDFFADDFDAGFDAGFEIFPADFLTAFLTGFLTGFLAMCFVPPQRSSVCSREMCGLKKATSLLSNPWIIKLHPAANGVFCFFRFSPACSFCSWPAP